MRGTCRRQLLEEWARRIRSRGSARRSSTAAPRSEKDLDDIDKMAKSYAAKEADLAVDEPMPDPATVARGVYAGDDFAVPRVELVKSPFAASGG